MKDIIIQCNSCGAVVESSICVYCHADTGIIFLSKKRLHKSQKRPEFVEYGGIGRLMYYYGYQVVIDDEIDLSCSDKELEEKIRIQTA